MIHEEKPPQIKTTLEDSPLFLVPESHGEVSDTSKVVCSGQRAQRVVGEGIRVQQRLTCDASHLAQDKQSRYRQEIEGVSPICQGHRRFETSVFFSEKINISTTGGSRVGFFQPDTNHP